jgi:hypothetical protein
MKTVVTGGLVAVIVAAGGFAGGVQVQKHRGSERTGAFPGGGAPAGMPVSSDAATTGTVTYTKGNVLYVKDADGNTAKVKIRSSADVTRTAEADGDKIHPGDQVVVQGAASKSGTVTATEVTATEGG